MRWSASSRTVSTSRSRSHVEGRPACGAAAATPDGLGIPCLECLNWDGCCGKSPPNYRADVEDRISAQPRLAATAAHYTLSWDQALPPAAADSLLTNLADLFLGKLSPEQFSAAMTRATA